MNFTDFIVDQRARLKSQEYVEVLWQKVKGDEAIVLVEPQVRTQYLEHLPLDFAKFMKSCIVKLREMKVESEEIDWNIVDRKYVATLVLQGLETEDDVHCNLYSANVYLLISVLSSDEMRRKMFFEDTFAKILELLKNVEFSEEMKATVAFILDDLKAFLQKNDIHSDDVVMNTLTVLYGFTFYTDESFESFSTDRTFENLSYTAFTCYQVLLDQFSRDKSDRKLFLILLCLASGFKLSSSSDLSERTKKTHQKNIRAFAKENQLKLSSPARCLITDALKFVLLDDEYDDYDAIVLLVKQLPSESYLSCVTFFHQKLNNAQYRKRLLNFVLPLLENSPEGEASGKRTTRVEIIVRNTVRLCGDQSAVIRERALQVLEKILHLDDFHVKKSVMVIDFVPCLLYLLSCFRK